MKRLFKFFNHSFNSYKYWNQRYNEKGNSGSGSYGRLAVFKAEIINEFLLNNDISSAIEYGCGDGNQLKLLKFKKYTGFDVSSEAIKICKQSFENDTTKSFFHYKLSKKYSADLTLSLDVIFHLVEDDVFFKYMDRLFGSAEKYVIIYSSNHEGQDYNGAVHVRHRCFNRYIAENFKDFILKEKIRNKYPFDPDDQDNTSFADFYIYEKKSISNEKNHERTSDESYEKLITKWKNYISDNLIPIISDCNEELEGNIYSKHHSQEDESSQLSNKRCNLYNILNIKTPTNILEIGFNSGFSTLLMKMTLPDVEITCVDLNEHKYVMPCFNKLYSEFSNLRMIKGSSYDIGLPKLIEENKKFDLIHIDGDHSLTGAQKDLDLCLKLSHENTVIIFDDTNIDYLNNLCSDYVGSGLLNNYEMPNFLNNQKYKHRFFSIVKNS